MKNSILIASLVTLGLAACGQQDDTIAATSTTSQVTPPAKAPTPATAVQATGTQTAQPTLPVKSVAAPITPPTTAAVPAQIPAGKPVAETTAPVTQTVLAANVLSVEEGKALAKKSGCFACHAATFDRFVIGPPWNEVGKKYKGDPSAHDNLIKWVHTGGTGRWGSAVMPPYSPRVSDSEIEQLVDFVLSLPKS